jgi:prephenate dehydrogenase
MNFGTVAILGPGLIGGSLALALAERSLAKRISIYARSAHALDAIRLAGVNAELTGNPSEAVRDADVVVLCVPIEAMAALVTECRDALKPTALVTDVGSVKGSVDREIAPLLKGRAQWIGSHPMAGSEQSGFVAARADLFENAAVIVTPTPQTAPETQKRAEEFWQALGGRVFTLSPAEHDTAIAGISHMPHLIAMELVNMVKREHLALAGGGFRDTTRIASGSPDLWAEILWANRHALKVQLDDWIKSLRDLKSLFELDNPCDKQGLREILLMAQIARAELPEKPKPTSSSRS